jgi:hypothetical protein
MKKLWIAIIATAAMAVASQADTIINFGGPVGVTNLVTSGGSTQNRDANTYQIVSPVDGSGDYDVNAAGQTRTFYGAASGTWNATAIVQDRSRDINNEWYNDPTKIDYMQMVFNMPKTGEVIGGTLTSMLAWESTQYLNGSAARELQDMTVRFESRGEVGTTASFLIETSAGWYKSVENSGLNSHTSVPVDWTLNVDSLSWVAFNEFGLSGGAVEADENDIQSAGVYFSASSVDGGFTGTKVEYVNVTAIPEPATMGLVISFGVGVLFIRRRLMM